MIGMGPIGVGAIGIPLAEEVAGGDPVGAVFASRVFG